MMTRTKAYWEEECIACGRVLEYFESHRLDDFCLDCGNKSCVPATVPIVCTECGDTNVVRDLKVTLCKACYKGYSRPDLDVDMNCGNDTIERIVQWVDNTHI